MAVSYCFSFEFNRKLTVLNYRLCAVLMLQVKYVLYVPAALAYSILIWNQKRACWSLRLQLNLKSHKETEVLKNKWLLFTLNGLRTSIYFRFVRFSMFLIDANIFTRLEQLDI